MMKYSAELNAHVIDRVITEGARICDLSKQYDIPEKRISFWVCQSRKQINHNSELSKDELLKRISVLESANKRLSADCDILKKATALFASRQQIK